MPSGYRVKIGPFWVSGTFKPSRAGRPSRRSNQAAAIVLALVLTLLVLCWLIG